MISDPPVTTSLNSYSAVVGFLLSRRLVRPSAVVHGRLHLQDASRRNRNVRVTVGGGRGCFVKTGADRHRRRTLCSEARTYRFLHRTLDPALARSLLVGLRVFDAAESVLVIDLVTGPTLRELQARSRRFPLRQLNRLGRSLGRLHRELLESGQLPDRCGIVDPFAFQLMQPKLGFIHTCSIANLDLIRIVQTSKDIRTGLETLAAYWKSTIVAAPCLIHGDMRLDNVCLGSEPASIFFVDWELAARGDPLLDAGMGLAELISHWLMSMPLPTGAEPADCMELAGVPVEALRAAARTFWRAYAAARGLKGDERATAFHMTILYAAAALIQLAFEHLQGTSRLTMHGLSHLQLSENLLARPIDGAAQLLGITT